MVEVDTETGSVELRRYVAVDDVGRVINPMIVEGQMHGGIAQGIAQALLEEAVYDEDGNLLTGSMLSYLVPSAAELPTFELDRTETPSPTNPLGVKGVGETGTIASPAAVMNAVVDALSPYGITDIEMPATPERVWRAHPGGEAMIPAPFDYEVADSVERGGRAARPREDAKLLAGGHSLLPLLRLRFARPSLLVDVGGWTSCCATCATPATGSRSGRSSRHHDLETDPLLQEHCPLVSHVAGLIGDPQVRHRGHDRRLGRARRPGLRPARRCCSRSTRSSWSAGPDGERTWAGATSSSRASSRPRSGRRTSLTEIRVPKLGDSGWAYVKFHQRAQDWATVGVAAVVRTATRTIALTNMGAEAAARARGRGADRFGSGGRRGRRGGRGRGLEPPTTRSARRSSGATWRGCCTRRALEEAIEPEVGRPDEDPPADRRGSRARAFSRRIGSFLRSSFCVRSRPKPCSFAQLSCACLSARAMPRSRQARLTPVRSWNGVVGCASQKRELRLADDLVVRERDERRLGPVADAAACAATSHSSNGSICSSSLSGMSGQASQATS